MTASGFTFDKSLKNVLANPVCICQLLQLYVCRAEVLNEIDFDRIEQLGTEFIDPSTQRSYYCDMLWKISYKDPKREPLYLVLLLELQSNSCRYMALRMNNYMTQFYLRLLKTTATQEFRHLPQVLPVVFYTGWHAWTGPLDISELIENGGAGIMSSKPLYQFKYLLLDIPRLINKAERNSPLWLLVDSLQINDVDKFWERWHNLKCVLPDLGNRLYQEAWVQLFGIVYEHLKEVDMSAELSLDMEFPQYTMKDLDDRFDAEGNMISTSQRYFKQGRDKGRAEGKNLGLAEGRTIGREEGKTEERLNNLKQVLSGKFGDIPPEQMEIVLGHLDEPDLFYRIIKAASPDELLQALR